MNSLRLITTTTRDVLLMALLAVGCLAGATSHAADPVTLHLRHRVETATGTGRHHTLIRDEEWDPAKTAVIVCDVWDYHHCFNAVQRLTEFGPRLNELVANARERGMTIIHSPSDCMPTYEGHPARKRAIETPKAEKLPADITAWCSKIPSEEAAVYPVDQSDGGEDDDPARHAKWAQELADRGHNPRLPWQKQAAFIQIDDAKDFITDKGDEVWSILESRGIENVILTGVHTNMCVLGRPFGLRQMARNGKRVALVRDMTDTMYNPQRWPFVSHFTGTDLIVEHVEKYVCPTITSDQFLGGQPFRHATDTRPRLAIIVSEVEYETLKTLPEFAARHLGIDFHTQFFFGSETEPNDIPGIEQLKNFDLALVSVRRRLLKPDQLNIVREFVAAGKPVVGIRTASHAWCLRGEEPPAGRAAWPEWDKQAFGGNYNNHYATDLKTMMKPVTGDGRGVPHPILTGIPAEAFVAGGSLYQTAPLAEGATVLINGEIEGKPIEPAAWTFKRADGGRSFYTSLGHKGDFENPVFNRLLVNALHWAATEKVPETLRESAGRDLSSYWSPILVPGSWEEVGGPQLKEYDGVAWYRCMIRIPEKWTGSALNLRLGSTKGNELTVYFQGEELESSEVSFAPDPLVDGGVLVEIPEGLVTPGEVHVLCVRVDNGEGPGGLAFKNPALHFGEEQISLQGRWQFRLGDDDSFATLPLPAKFAAATEAVFGR